MNAMTAIDHRSDTRPVVVVHTLFRRELRLAGGLVRRVPAGEGARAGMVAAHLDLVLRGLHHHHELEDELIWPRLRDRVPTEVVPKIERMERQHANLSPILARIQHLVPEWGSTAGSEERDELALLLDELYAELVDHLDDEERQLLPVVSRYVSQPELDDIGRRAEAANRGSERALVFGMLQHEGDPEVVANMLRAAPLPVRVLLPRVARRVYRRHALAIHGTSNP